MAASTSACECWQGLPPLSLLKPLTCGVFWFFHNPKTAGMTVEARLNAATSHATHHRRRWIYHSMLHTDWAWTRWNSSSSWHRVLKELEQPQPLVVVSQHHTSPGFGEGEDIYASTLAPLRAKLRAKGCELRLATLLREPVARTTSALFFNHVPSADLRRWVARDKQGGNGQAKYLLRTNHFPESTTGDPAEAWPLLAPAAAALSRFDMVGRVEELPAFLRAGDLSLGLEPPNASSPATAAGATTAVGSKAVASQINVTPEQFRYPLSAADRAAIGAANAVDALLYERYCGPPWMCTLLGSTAGAPPSEVER